ncbi:hypothetical protein F2P81_011989 [Scophthalmus maximus]|uniref:Uncharacterized protein n=1 Tax=Scophthalmus maximus TaxID=52904 RepID=A0A6A4STB7_SCOMX|nr:hypothetical protein F2P81_011989 [Scophthalmus maximus]
MAERLAVTSSLIGGDPGSGTGSEVTEDRRREMLACDWFMSGSLTQTEPAVKRKVGDEHRQFVEYLMRPSLTQTLPPAAPRRSLPTATSQQKRAVLTNAVVVLLVSQPDRSQVSDGVLYQTELHLAFNRWAQHTYTCG